MEDHAPIGIKRIPPGSKKLVNIVLLDAVATEFDFDRRNVADKTSSRKAHPDILDVGAGDTFGLFHCIADGGFRRIHVGNISALHAAAFPLPRAKDLNVTGRQPLRNERRHLP